MYARRKHSHKPRVRLRRFPLIMAACLLLSGVAFAALEKTGATNVLELTGLSAPRPEIGEQIDSFNGVAVYYNGPIANVSGRSTGPDGYNIGQKYQCVEFVKRYYYEALKHKMPDPWGHAKDFFNRDLPDGSINRARGLIQYHNGGGSAPQVHDLMVFGGHKYGHVAIVCETGEDYVEIIQQNPGPFEPSRERLTLTGKRASGSAGAYGGQQERFTWHVGGGRTPSGWLRKE